MAYARNRPWTCPFLTSTERRVIRCECGRVDFPDEVAYRAYTSAYCAGESGWKTCSLARNRLEFYDRMGV